MPQEKAKEYSFELNFESEEAHKLEKANYINSLFGIDAILVKEHLIEGASLLSISKREKLGYKKLMTRTKRLKSKIRNFVNN